MLAALVVQIIMKNWLQHLLVSGMESLTRYEVLGYLASSVVLPVGERAVILSMGNNSLAATLNLGTIRHIISVIWTRM